MPLTIPVAHDFTCPWCWVGLFQTKRLKREFGVEIDWRGYELYPDELDWPERKPPEVPQNRPKTPSRLDLLLWADQVELPKVEKPKHMRIHNAHEAVEYAKTEDVADELVEALYRAYWEEGLEINHPQVIREVAAGIVRDLDSMQSAITERRFKDRIVGFDAPSYKTGVFNVPTFFVGEELIAEHPYAYIRKKVQEWLDAAESTGIYTDIAFPEAPADRPYVYLNMVASIDGKTISGTRDESVADLGSQIDHQLMKRLEASADAVMLGAQTLRATSPKWNPQAKTRIVVTGSGNVPFESAFLSNGDAYVATTLTAGIEAPEGVEVVQLGTGRVDLCALLHRLRSMGVKRLLALGGSELNAQLIRQELVDELFLTIAPKVKLGRNLPTYAGGEPLTRDELQRYRLLEHHFVGDEVFLRYRRS